MKKVAISIIILAVVLNLGICFAESDAPNLVGTWVTQSQTGVILKGKKPGAKTHSRGEFTTLKGELTVTKQEGRVLHGTFTSPRATEKFVAVISMDNKSLYLADEDGFMEGQIVNKDQINIIYRHSTAKDSVVAVGTCIRKK